MVEFFRKFENHVIKIARVNLLDPHSQISKFTLILRRLLGVRCDVDIFKLAASL